MAATKKTEEFKKTIAEEHYLIDRVLEIKHVDDVKYIVLCSVHKGMEFAIWTFYSDDNKLYYGEYTTSIREALKLYTSFIKNQ